MKFSRRTLYRCVFYLAGMFSLAYSVAFALNSDLGISPVNSLPNALSLVTGVSLGTMVTFVFCGFVLIQYCLRRLVLRNVKGMADYLLLGAQLLVSTVFGYITNFAKRTLGSFCFPGVDVTLGAFSLNTGRLAMIFASILFIGFGISLCVNARLVAMPPDSMTGVLSETFHIPFHNMKVIQDCVSVFLSAAIGFAAFRTLTGIGIGTVITAVLAGKAVGLVQRFLKPFMDRVCGFNAPASSV